MPLPIMGNPYATQGYLNKLKAATRELVERAENFIEVSVDDTVARRMALVGLQQHLERVKELLK